jgi:hypothetical protein
LYLFVSLSASLPVSVAAAELRLPDDPRQSIGYWKVHTLSVEEDSRVELAQNVFTRLLRAWDNSRVAPGLYVINSTANAWAASLADGNILLSLEAIDISLRGGNERGEFIFIKLNTQVKGVNPEDVKVEVKVNSKNAKVFVEPEVSAEDLSDDSSNFIPLPTL